MWLFRRFLEEENELDEVTPEAVPSEVKEWLAITFTKTAASGPSARKERPRFKSVANVVRAGLIVDK